MPMPMSSRPLLPAALCACLLFAAAGAWAQARTVYKVQLPDGRIEFTDEVPKDAKVLETFQPREGNRMPPPARPTAPPPSASPGGRPPAKAPALSLDAAVQEVQEAERALVEARRARDLGADPMEHERQGLKGGGSRVLPAYEQRQRALNDAVAAAEERLRRALEARNALR